MFDRLTPGVRIFVVKNVLGAVVAMVFCAESNRSRTRWSAALRAT